AFFMIILFCCFLISYQDNPRATYPYSFHEKIFGSGLSPYHTVQYRNIQADSLTNFIYMDKFISHVRTCGIAGPELERGNIEKSLIAGCRRTVGGTSKCKTRLYNRVILRYR